jgi:hypothetical protein
VPGISKRKILLWCGRDFKIYTLNFIGAMLAAKGDLELLTAVVSGFKNSRAALNLRAYAA